MKILYTTEFSDLAGGGQAGLLLLLARLDRRRFAPVVMVPAEGEVARRARELGCAVLLFPLPPVRSVFAALLGALRLRRLLKAEGIALIHTDAPRSTLYAACAKAGLGIALVWHIRTEKRDGLLDRFLEKRCDRLILVARALAARFSAAARKRCVVIYNGVDLEPVGPPDRASLPAISRPLIICPARLDGEDKGQSCLIDALPLVRRRLPAVVWFVGRGDAAVRARLESRAAALGLAGAVHFLGFRSDLRALLSLADVVALPSLHEAFPRVLLEAMAASKPVVATRVGGIPELVAEGETGLLVPPGDPGALAEALASVLEDRARLEGMGQAARRRAERFSAAEMVRAIEAVYDAESGGRAS